jgi:hypothetical protein
MSAWRFATYRFVQSWPHGPLYVINALTGEVTTSKNYLCDKATYRPPKRGQVFCDRDLGLCRTHLCLSLILRRGAASVQAK